MWNGQRPGPRGGMPFRGDPRGAMFEGRGGPIPEFRGRDGMNMGLRPQDRPPMDMRRFDCPPEMRGRDMEPLDMDMRGREPPRDFFRPGDDQDMSLRRRYEIEIRNKLQNAPGGFMGPGRHPADMGGRDMPPRNMREADERFVDMRERERFHMDMPGFNNAPMDARGRRLPMEPMGRNEGMRDMCERERPRMGMEDIDGFSMDTPPRERGMMDFERRGGALPLNPRRRFESDIDLRSRMGASGELRERSPLMFGENDGVPMDVRGRPDMPPDLGGQNRPVFRPGEGGTLRDREFPEPGEGPVGVRGRENESLLDEWRNQGMRERGAFPPAMNRAPPPFPREGQGERFPAGVGKASLFTERDRPITEFTGKDDPVFGFPHPEREVPGSQKWKKNAPTDGFTGRDPPKGVPEPPPFLPTGPPLSAPNVDNDGKLWPRDRDGKPDRNTPNLARPPYPQEKKLPTQDNRFSNERAAFKGSKEMAPDQGPKRGTSGPEELQSNNGGERRDQDYRDIDYRTASGRAYDYDIGKLQGAEKSPKESKPTQPQRLNDSGSQDQDYRSASVKDKVSHTISISGIPKTATMQQILGAFAVRDGIPMQGMKIRDVVPGYSYDTAYVEFLNLEDAVHFMESNQGSVKVGIKTAQLKYIQPDRSAKEAQQQEPPPKAPQLPQQPLLPSPVVAKAPPEKAEVRPKPPAEPVWSSLTPEAWQQQVDQQLQQQEADQQAEAWANRSALRHTPHQTDPIFKESKTMIIKNVKPTTTVETILKALDPYAYLDERNVRLVKGKPPGSKCFCFVDMDSHEQVTRLVELLTKPRPLVIDGVRVYAEVAKPLKNQNYRKEYDQSSTSLLGYPPDSMMEQQYYPQPPHTPVASSALLQGDPTLTARAESTLASDPQQPSSLTQGADYTETAAPDHSFPAGAPQATPVPLAATLDGTDAYSYATETPDLSTYLYDATSGFYYDPQTTLYYDPSSRYFYNAETQQYLYWDSASKTYIPVPGSSTDPQPPTAQPGLPAATVTEAVPVPIMAPPVIKDELPKAPDTAPEKREEDEAPRTDKKDKEKEEKPRSLAAFKIMKDMERWAKIQNRQKESVRAPSPVLKTMGGSDERKTSKAADAAFAIFERKVTGGDDLFKKPLAPPRKDEKGSGKRSMGSLGLLADDYAAGSDEEEEEKHEAPRPSKSQLEEKEDKLTDWKKMACLLCRRQFPNKDALMRHQQLSDLHKQNMEIHLKIKRSKKELEALENQEKEMSARESNGSPEMKRRRHQNQGSWSGGCRDVHKGSERPGLGSEPVERKKKEPVVWNHATYKQAVRKAMFARFKELE